MTCYIVDAHQHFWELGRFDYFWMTPERHQLRHSFLPEHLRPLLAQNHVNLTVAVQAHASIEETLWLLELGSAHEFIAGVVGWVDLTAPTLGKQLDKLQRDPKFKGVRHPLEAESDDGWMVKPAVVAGLCELARRGLPFDLVIFPRHLKLLPQLRDLCPNLRLVVDHMAKPPIAKGPLEGWAREIEIASQLPDLWCKLSGMITEADHSGWKVEDLQPYVDQVVSSFGYERLMFGSDWPVCLLAGSYEQVVSSTRHILGPLSAEAARKVWGENAKSFYEL